MVAMVESAIPVGLPDEVVQELRQELVLAMMGGRSDARHKITPSKIKRATQNAWRNVLPETPYSVDAPIGEDGAEEMTYRDVLEDASIYSDPVALIEIARRFEVID